MKALLALVGQFAPMVKDNSYAVVSTLCVVVALQLLYVEEYLYMLLCLTLAAGLAIIHTGKKRACKKDPKKKK